MGARRPRLDSNKWRQWRITAAALEESLGPLKRGYLGFGFDGGHLRCSTKTVYGEPSWGSTSYVLVNDPSASVGGLNAEVAMWKRFPS